MRFPESVMMSASWGWVVLVQVTLVALLGLLAWLLARKSGPPLRGAVLLATLVGLLFLPGLARLVPTCLPLPQCVCPPATSPVRAPLTETGRFARAVAESQNLVLKVELPAARDTPRLAQAPQETTDDKAAKAKVEAVFNLAAVAESLVLAEPAAEPPASSWPVAPVVLGVWLLGALFFIGRSLRQLLILYRCSWQARDILDAAWTGELAALAQRDGLSSVSLKESDAITSPLILGLFRPVILLPPGWKNWSTQERTLILEHELAHIRRRDFLAGLVAELVVCLCWFHPLILWLAARLRLEQEYAADAWVASVANDSRDYIRCLARLALEHDQGRRSLAPALWRRRPEILRRIHMLRHSPKGLPSRLSKWTRTAIAFAAALACLAAATLGPLGSDVDAKPADSENTQTREDPLGDPLPAGVLARLGTVRLRHQGEVTFVSFVPGGQLLTAGKDNTIRLWDLENRKEVRRFTRPTPVPVKAPEKEPKEKARQARIEAMLLAQSNRGGTFQAAVSADGKTLAAAGGNAIQLWELSTGKELRKIVGPESGLTGLIFSPDGKILAGRTGGGAVYVWSAETGKEMHHIKPTPRPGQRDLVLSFGSGGGLTPAPGLAFTPDSKSLAVIARDYQKDEIVRSIKFFDVDSGKQTRMIGAPKGAGLSSVAISQDGKLLAYGSGETVHLCAADTGKEIHKIAAADGIHMLVFSPDGKTLAIRGRNQRVRLVETKSGTELRQLNEAERSQRTGGFVLVANEGPTGPEMRAMAFSPDGKRIASAAGTTIRVWETATGKEVSLAESHWRAPSTVVVSADGKTAITWGADRIVRRWDPATGKALGAFAAPAGTTIAAFSGDGRTVALANEDGTIRLHDTATGKERSRLKGQGSALAFGPGDRMLAIRGGNTIYLHDLTGKVEVRQMSVRPRNPQGDGTFILFLGGGDSQPGTGPGVAFSPDGKLVAMPVGGDGGRSSSIVFFDLASGKELRKIEAGQPIISFAFSPDSRILATETPDETVTLWETASAKQRGRLGQPVSKPPQGGAGRMLVEVAIDGDQSIPSPPGGPTGVSFSPDGRALAVRGEAGAVRIWDIQAGKQIGKLQGHKGGVQTVHFAANGKTLVSGSNDTTALLWDAATVLKNLASPEPVELSAEEVSSLWGDLVGTDAIKAGQGVYKLAAGAKQAMPFLAKQLKPAPRIPIEKINGWLAELESEKFSVRQSASANLLKTGAQAIEPLKKLLATAPPLETRKRAEELLDQLTSGTLTTEQLRVVRAVEALERIATPEARRLLKALADGGPGELPTREAQSALDRLSRTRP